MSKKDKAIFWADQAMGAKNLAIKLLDVTKTSANYLRVHSWVSKAISVGTADNKLKAIANVATAGLAGSAIRWSCFWYGFLFVQLKSV